MIAAYLARSPGGGWPDATWASALLGFYGIAVVPTTIAGSADGAADVAGHAGYPLVIKTALPGGVHKSDLGGVRLGIGSDAELREAYAAISSATSCPEVVVQPMVSGGTAELVVGIAVEPSFGPIVMAGIGGIATDVLDDKLFAPSRSRMPRPAR